MVAKVATTIKNSASVDSSEANLVAEKLHHGYRTKAGNTDLQTRLASLALTLHSISPNKSFGYIKTAHQWRCTSNCKPREVFDAVKYKNGNFCDEDG